MHSLPYDLHVHICSYLEFPEDLVQLSVVSRYFYRVAHDSRLWQYLNLSQYPHTMTNRVLRSLVLSHFGPEMQEQSQRHISAQVQEELHSGMLDEDELEGEDEQSRLQAKVADRLPHIKSLWLDGRCVCA
jgi:F-box-like